MWCAGSTQREATGWGASFVIPVVGSLLGGAVYGAVLGVWGKKEKKGRGGREGVILGRLNDTHTKVAESKTTWKSGARVSHQAD